MNNIFFICGNSYFIKDYIKGLNNVKSFDLEEVNFTNISNCLCGLTIMGEAKTVIINKFPNNKKEREFCVDLISNAQSNAGQLYFIDLEGKVKYSNSGKPEHDFASIYNKWIILDNDFDPKESDVNIRWVQNRFKNLNINIDYDAAGLLINNVGGSKEMTIQEIDKISMLGLNHIKIINIIENTAKIKKEQILYKFTAALDEGLESAANMLEVFLNNDIHPNVIIEMLLKRARWNLFIADGLLHGLSMGEIKNRIMSRKNKWSKMESVSESQGDINKHFTGLNFSILDKFNTGETISSPFIVDIIIKSFNNRYYGFTKNHNENFQNILNIYSESLNIASSIRFNWDLHKVYLLDMIKLCCGEY